MRPPADDLGGGLHGSVRSPEALEVNAEHLVDDAGRAVVDDPTEGVGPELKPAVEHEAIRGEESHADVRLLSPRLGEVIAPVQDQLAADQLGIEPATLRAPGEPLRERGERLAELVLVGA